MAVRVVTPLHLADFRFPDDGVYPGESGIVMGYAVTVPAGVLVVDTGIGFGHEWVEETLRPRARRLPDVLAAAGLASGEVVALVNSHLHFDHSGQNSVFPGVPIHVQRDEWAAAHAPDYTVLEWVEFPGARYEPVDGDHELFPGVRLIATPGHTAGHQSVVVETAEGVTVIAGQAVYTAGEWRGEQGAREGMTSAWDRDRYARSVDRLRALDPVRVFFGHDREPWAR